MRDLIDVSFEDRTNYTTFVNDDVVGLAISHCWGPIGVLNKMDRSTFLKNYPIALPFTGTDLPSLKSLANAKRVFDMGASTVEVVRVDNTNGYLWIGIAPSKFSPVSDDWSTLQNIYDIAKTAGFSGYGWEPNLENIKNNEIKFNSAPGQEVNPEFVVYFKYPGLPSASDAPYKGLKINLVFGGEDQYDLTIQIVGVTESGSESVIESFTGGVDPEQIVDGESYYIVNKVAKSKFIGVVNSNLSKGSWVFSTEPRSMTMMLEGSEDGAEPEGFTESEESSVVTEHKLEYCLNTGTIDLLEYKPAIFNDDTTLLVDAISKYFSNRKLSDATILVAADGTKEGYKAIQEVAEFRKNCVAIVGSDSFKSTVEDVKGYLQNLVRDKFSIWINGSERVSILGKVYLLDCTCGYAGRLAYTARVQKINQLPSADANGTYPNASLVDSLSYDEVLEIHELGVGSVYTSTSGPQIFGIRSLHPRQQSYYGKFNVSRVLSFILKNFYNEVDMDIHTDTVSDDVARQSAETRLNSILQNFAPDNIKANSYAYIISDDAETNGGEYLIIVAEIWFKKLVESVKIRIVATDSSVSAEVS